MQELKAHVTSANGDVLPFLGHINALLTLHRALVVCKTAAKADLHTAIQPLVKKEDIPAGKSVDDQWRFKRTIKYPGRKGSGIILMYAVYTCKLEANPSVV